jgi:hypothetical protein
MRDMQGSSLSCWSVCVRVLNSLLETYDDFLFWLYDRGVPPKILKWLTPGYYVYLFSDLKWANETAFHKLEVIWCRIKGHPNGPVWFSQGLEPDMSCRDCGDEL